MIVITKFYTCQNYLVFKEVFMQESNKDLLVLLLEKILKVKIMEVKIADFKYSSCFFESQKDNFHLLLTTPGIMKVIFVKIKRMIFLVKVIRFNIVIYLFLIEIFLLYYKLI